MDPLTKLQSGTVTFWIATSKSMSGTDPLGPLF